MKQLLEKWNKYLKDNRWKYHILNETAFSRIVTDYGERGYVIITSDRTCEAGSNRKCSEEEISTQAKQNTENMKSLIQDTRGSGFGYLPTLGGYKEDLIDPKTGKPKRDAEGNVVKVDTDKPENSIVVMARPDKNLDHEKLKQFGMNISGKYNQDSFFYKPPNNVDKGAYWIKPDGSIDRKFETFTINDLTQEFYTQMVRGPQHRFTALDEKKEMFFRVRTSPTSTAEARQRYGEYFMKFID